MASSTFGRGWPACDVDRVVIARSDGLRVSIHAELSDLVAMLLDLTELRGYNVRPGQTWGFACRAIRGTSTPSNHSWATAIDVNSLENPQKRPLTTNLPDDVVDMWKTHGFRWGGDYRSSTPDPMHFEFMGTVAQARTITARLRRFLGNAAPPRPRPPGRPGRPTPRPYPGLARYGDRGSHVRVWQQVLNERGYDLVVDGVFKSATNRAVMDWQRRSRIRIDGIAGPTTWHWLLNA